MLELILKYGIKKIIRSKETFIFILCIIVLPNIIVNLGIENEIELIKSYSTIMISISTGMLALTLTILSIIIGMMSDNLIKYIKETNTYCYFVVPFYLNSIIWIIGLITNIIILVFTYTSYIFTFKKLAIYSISFSIAIFIMGLVGAIELVDISIRLGKYKIISTKKED